MTKRQLSHWQRETRIQRFAMLGGLIVIVAVLVVVGTGLYLNQFKPLREVVIKVDNTDYTMDYYINMLSYYGLQQGTQNIPYMADYVAQVIEQNKLIQDGAAKLDPPVIVTDDEVNQTIQQRKLTSDQTRKDAIRTELLLTKLKDYFNNPDNAAKNNLVVPASGEQKAVLAMFLESQQQANDVIARLNKGEKFQDLASQLSLESNSKSKDGDFGWVPKGILPSLLGDTLLEDKAFSSDTSLNTPTIVAAPDTTKDVGYWLLKVTETKDEGGTQKLHLYAMLLGSQEEASNIKAQLDAGADWATLAKANSQYGDVATDGGDQGFKGKGDMPTAVDNALFGDKKLDIGKVSDPIQDTNQNTKGGVWLTEVTGSDPNKTIDGANRTTLVANAVNTWAQQLWTDNQDKVQNLLTSDQKQYAIDKAQSR